MGPPDCDEGVDMTRRMHGTVAQQTFPVQIHGLCRPNAARKEAAAGHWSSKGHPLAPGQWDL